MAQKYSSVEDGIKKMKGEKRNDWYQNEASEQSGIRKGKIRGKKKKKRKMNRQEKTNK